MEGTGYHKSCRKYIWEFCKMHEWYRFDVLQLKEYIAFQKRLWIDVPINPRRVARKNTMTF